MTQKINFAPLDAGDAKDLHDLQKKLFPIELTESLNEIETVLENADKVFNCNHSFAVYDNLEMVGYVFAYIDSKSIFHNREEEIFYVKEFGLLPGYERYLRLMISKLTDLWLTYAPQLAAEAHAVEEAKNKWLRIPRILQQFEIKLETRLGNRDGDEQNEGSPDYFFLRWEAGLSERVPREYLLPSRGWQYRKGIIVNVISDVRKLEALRNDWNNLLDKTSGENFLGSLDFVKTWWKYFGIWLDLHVIVIRRNDEVIGIAPLMKECWNREGRFEQELSIIGEPTFMVQPQLLVAGNEDLCLSAMMAYLGEKEIACSWQNLVLAKQRSSILGASLSRCFSGSWYSSFVASPMQKGLQLGNDFQHLVGKQLPEKAEYNSLLGLQDHYEYIVHPDLDSSQQVLSTISKIEENISNEEQRCVSNSNNYFFYHALVELLGKENKLRWYVCRTGDKTIAANLGFVENHIYYVLLQAHGDDCSANIDDSLSIFAIKKLIEEGVTHLVFVNHRKTIINSVFTTKDEPLVSFTVRLRGSLLARIKSTFKDALG